MGRRIFDAMNYLDFEEPIKTLREQLDQAKEIQDKNDLDMATTVEELEVKIQEVIQEIYGKLTPWQRVQVSRHPDRPYTLDYIQALTDGNFLELHGDRTVKDDKAMVGGLGELDGRPVMFIGQQKGVNTKMRQYRNFGMANPEGYRKALRLMKLAEKFNVPVVTLIDTPGAYPGLEAEERGQGEAIARNLLEMCQLQVPILCMVIGEGASGGALGIGIGDKVFMMENTWYSVISPESCSSILWRSWDYKMQAAEALKLTGDDMKGLGLVDDIVPEQLGGAHANREETFATVKSLLLKELDKLQKQDADKRINTRLRKFSNMGVVAG